MNLNWDMIGPGPDNGFNALMQGYQFGQQVRQQRRAEEADAEQRKREAAQGDAYRMLIENPRDTGAVNALAQYDPQAAYRLAQDQRKAGMEQDAQMQTEIQRMANLLDDSTDEASYRRNLDIAQQMGMDTSQAPPNFDPEWIATQKRIVEAFVKEPQKMTAFLTEVEALGLTPQQAEQAWLQKYSPIKTVPYNPGGGVAAYNVVTGEVQPVVVPNDGSQPAGGDAPRQTSTKEEYDALPPGAQYIAPDGSVRVKGGAASNGGGGFPASQ